MPEEPRQPRTSPTGDVTYDEEALRDAERKFHVSETDEGRDDDPPGGHDPAALDEAARRMGAKD